MNPTKNDLPAEKRTALAQLLNERLADLIDLGLQAKQAHWNVKGPTFIALHELFDSVAEETEEFVDDVAERIVALGGIAEETINAVGKITKAGRKNNLSKFMAVVLLCSSSLRETWRE